jgi:hypothetical protein
MKRKRQKDSERSRSGRSRKGGGIEAVYTLLEKSHQALMCVRIAVEKEY